MRALGIQDKEQFARDGFVVLPGMYSAAEIRDLSDWIDRLSRAAPAVGAEAFYYDPSMIDPNENVLNRIEYFAGRDAYIREFVRGPRLMRAVEHFLGEPAALFKEKINFKLPGGGGFKPHQDIQPGWDDYAPFFVSVLIAVDDNGEENGCLELAKGHHKRGWIGRRFEPLEGDELKGIDFRKYPMKAGDAAIFDCFVPHQSEPNLSRSPRRNVYLTYNRASDGDHRELYFSDKRKNFPPNHERNPSKTYSFRV